MNILFLITSNGKGAGGHFNSLHQISQEIGKSHEVKIFLLGKGNSPIVKSNPFFEAQIKIGHSLKDFRHLRKALQKHCNHFEPDVIHCFDTKALNSVLWAKFAPQIPIVMNKCGGRNPLQSNYQHADATVVFSKENQEWYLENTNYNNKSIFLIPNRVEQLKFLSLEKRKEEAAHDKLTFVRISRLGGAYELTLMQTYTLLDKLAEKQPVEFFVIGTIQDQTRFNTLKKIGESKPYKVHFITDGRAFKGSDFLYLADFVVGTGRSFMEASSLGIPTLTPAKNTQIPILVNKENVDGFLATNFSERNVAEENEEITTLREIKEIITNKEYKAKVKKETLGIFKTNFGTSKIQEKYNIVYNFVIQNPLKRRKLILKNLPYLLKFVIRGE